MKKYIAFLILLFAISFSIWGFSIDVKNTVSYYGLDLRNRVIGARLIEAGMDPYYFKWNSEYSEQFLDPGDDLSVPVSRVTVPPTVLLLHSFMSDLPYFDQKILWLIIQWFALLLSIFLLSMQAQSIERTVAIWMIGLVVISGGVMWRFHVESGQIYICYVLLIILSYCVLNSRLKWNQLATGIILGFTAALRPTVVLMIIPILAFKKYEMLAGSILGFVGNIVTAIVCYGLSPWKSYFSAMQIHGQIHIGAIQGLFQMNRVQSLEGVAYNGFFPFPEVDSSLQTIMLGNDIVLLTSKILLILLLIFCSITYLYLQGKNKSISVNLFFLIGTALVLVSEFFLPAARYPYNDVLWLIPLCLIVVDDNIKYVRVPLALLGILILCSFSWVFYGNPYPYAMNYPYVTGPIELTLIFSELAVPFVILWIASILFRKSPRGLDQEIS